MIPQKVAVHGKIRREKREPPVKDELMNWGKLGLASAGDLLRNSGSYCGTTHNRSLCQVEKQGCLSTDCTKTRVTNLKIVSVCKSQESTHGSRKDVGQRSRQAETLTGEQSAYRWAQRRPRAQGQHLLQCPPQPECVQTKIGFELFKSSLWATRTVF